MFNTTHNWNMWIVNFQQFIIKLKIWSSIKHDNTCSWFVRINFLMCSRNLLHIKVPYFTPPYAKWPWQSTSYNTATGRFFPETKIFNSGIMEIVAQSPRNKNPKISDSFLIKIKFLSMFWSWIISKRSLDIRFLLGGW